MKYSHGPPEMPPHQALGAESKKRVFWGVWFYLFDPWPAVK